MLEKTNIRLLLRYELFGRLLWTAVLLPLLFGLLNLAMHVSGYRYLTGENFRSFVFRPFTILIILIAALVVALTTLTDICATIYILTDRCNDCAETLVYSVRKMLSLVLSRRTVLLVPVALLSVIVGGVGLGVVAAQHFAVGGFILNWLIQHSLMPAAVFGSLVIAVLFFCFLYVFHFCVLEGDSFRDANRKNRKMRKGHRTGEVLVIVAVQLAFYIIYFAVAAFGILVIVGVRTALRRFGVSYAMPTFAMVTLLTVFSVFFISLCAPVLYIAISWMYDRRTGMFRKIKWMPVSAPTEKRRLRLHKTGTAVLTVSSLILCMVYIYMGYRGRFNLPIEYIHTTEVTAHRGASRDCPENTMAAFREAAEQGADWIELDIQQSRDRQLFIMHDRNFKRTTGVNKFAWELDYDEIRTLDAGKWFGREFAGEPIPLLSEAIDFAKEVDIRLNIELKPTGNETDFEQQLVDLIHEKEFVDHCVVTSQLYDSIKKVKDLDENIQTVYVMGFAYGPINNLTAADQFSINVRSVTDQMVSRIHNAGRQILAWTVNSRYRVKDMMEMHVDNVITDRPAMAKKVVMDELPGSWVQEFVRSLNRLLAVR